MIGPESQAATQTATRSGRRGGWRIILGVLLAVLLACGGFTAFYLHHVNTALDKLIRDNSVQPNDAARPTMPTPGEGSSAEGPFTYVLIGDDSRGTNDKGRSDALIVAQFSADRKHLYLVSFPRDMWVNIPDHGMGKINSAYAHGGPALTVQTLEQLTGVRMDHIALINFEGFAAMTSAIGGVEVYNQHASSNLGYDFPAGMIHLKGEQALAYVREREGLPNGDLDRAERQREVVKAILGKVATPKTLANPIEFGEVIGAFTSYVTVDEGLTNIHLLQMAQQSTFAGGTQIISLQAPISGFGTSADGQSIVLVDEAGLAELGAAMRDDTMDGYLQAHP